MKQIEEREIGIEIWFDTNKFHMGSYDVACTIRYICEFSTATGT